MLPMPAGARGRGDRADDIPVVRPHWLTIGIHHSERPTLVNADGTVHPMPDVHDSERGGRPVTGSLAHRIDHLFKAVRPKGREYSYEEVARGCEALTSGTFSKTYVWQLRTGQRDNPTKRHLEALSAFFGVPVAYFFDDQVVEDVNAQLALVLALRDADVRDIALRAVHLDGAGRRSLARIVTEISRLQRPEAEGAAGSESS
ncbi:hypothetical protein [Krasilnikovia sp. M28-CT-15]|uniref:hypothetical protein n=1 Tax=Krasilnikovia sp. M28-CT-15 TaxID=3373540 RepID=UPI003876B5D0